MEAALLYGIDPILSPDLLRCLRAMGHGDTLVITDANFPAEAMGRACLRCDGVDATTLLRAILPLMPLDQFVDAPVHSMEVVGDPSAVPDAVAEFQTTLDSLAPTPSHIAPLERFAFYDQARAAFAVVQTGDRRLYANLILRKGVIA